MEILVTGASRGIGYQVALKFASNPNNNVYVIARSEDKLNNLKEEAFTRYGFKNIFPIVLDLEAEYRNNDLSKLIKLKSNHIDILINNAGYLDNSLFENTSIDIAEKIFKINFFAPASLIKALLPIMGNGRTSHIINIGSMGGYQGSLKYPGLSFYSASKAALSSLTECLAEEFKDSDISFNCLALGAVQTEMLEEAFPGYKAPVSASQMADYIVEFAINGNKKFNGKVIPVNLN